MHTLIDYVDPASPMRRRMNLVEAMGRVPSKPHRVPEEDQLTAVLGWLCDHSAALARAFADLLVEDSDEIARDAIAHATTFSARTWVALPKATGVGYWWPDLEIAADSRLLQILVEVKVGAEPNQYELGEEVILQPDAYAAAWEKREASTVAEVRRVATLTRGFEFPVAQSPMRARDITWSDVEKLLDQLCRNSALEPECSLVAEELGSVVRSRVLAARALAPHAGRLLAVARDLLLDIVRQTVGAAPVTGGTKIVTKDDYVGTYLKAKFRDQQFVDFWLALVPEGGRYAALGAPDAVWLKIERADPAPTAARFAASGLQLMQDAAGYRKWAAYFPLPTINGLLRDPGAVATSVASEVSQLIHAVDEPPGVA